MGYRGIGSWIDRRAEIGPDTTAVIWGDRSYTYLEFAARIRRLSNALSDLGVGHGDRVAWLGPNHPAFLELLFATLRLGAILNPVNHRLDGDVISHILEDSAPKIAVLDSSIANMRLPLVVQQTIAVGNQGDEVGDGGRSPSLDQLIEDASEEAPVQAIDPDDVCMLPYTSGTTGMPKGVMLTHANVTWNVMNFMSSADFMSTDVTIAIAPFFRVGGTGVNVLPILFKGGTVVIPERGDPDEIVRLIETHRVSVGFGNPDLLDAISRSPLWETSDISSLRMFIAGGAPIPRRLIDTYFRRGVTFVQGYGLSEAAPLVLVLDEAHAFEKAGSAGKPPLFMDVRVVDRSGADVERGKTGELLVRGPNVMKGYWRSPEETERTLSDGWLRTGDAARVDVDGFIWIVDRMKDAYLSNGELVYPGDVERVIADHPAVLEAGVVGAPGGEAPSEGRAFVVVGEGTTVTEDDLLRFYRDRSKDRDALSSVTLVDRLPRNAVGKLIRHDLLAQAAHSRV
jgi:fatty-acyl-CoA synthase